MSNRKLDAGFFASNIPFEKAKTGEFIHTYESAISIFENKNIKNIHWAYDIEDYEDECFNCEIENSNENFNVLIPKSLFDYEHFRGWAKQNKEIFWVDERYPSETRGVDYF